MAEKALICSVCLTAIAAVHSIIPSHISSHLFRVFSVTVAQAEATVAHEASGAGVVAGLSVLPGSSAAEHSGCFQPRAEAAGGFLGGVTPAEAAQSAVAVPGCLLSVALPWCWQLRGRSGA